MYSNMKSNVHTCDFKFLGSGFASNEMFLFGEIDMQIKLVPDYSAGTVLAFYVSKQQLIHSCSIFN